MYGLQSRSGRKIIGAFMVGFGVVVLTLIFRPTSTPATGSMNEITPVIVTDTAKKPIAITDSNNDGIPDWQEALLSGNTAFEGDLNASSTYEVPDTLTDQFALQFFERMVNSQVYGDFSDTPEQVVADSSTHLLAQATDPLITRSEITVSQNNSVVALAAYGEKIAIIINTYGQNTGENEAQILERALSSESPAELEKLDPKIAAYKKYLEETKKVIVPSSVITEHLLLLNSYQALLNDIKAMRNAFADPMLSLVRLKRYQDDATMLNTALVAIYTKLVDEGATWTEDAAVHLLIDFDS